MGTGATYAFITFGMGVLSLLGWLYGTIDNPRSWEMLKKSLVVFVLPILFVPWALLQLPYGIWVLAAGEEGLKAFASTREERRVDKFWLIALFGIWELMLDKPFWGIALSRSSDMDSLALATHLYATALPVLMHLVTAAIYAFCFERRLWAAFIVSWIVHAVFNEAVTYFYLSPVAIIIETTVLSVILIFILWRRRRISSIDIV